MYFTTKFLFTRANIYRHIIFRQPVWPRRWNDKSTLSNTLEQPTHLLPMQNIKRMWLLLKAILCEFWTSSCSRAYTPAWSHDMIGLSFTEDKHAKKKQTLKHFASYKKQHHVLSVKTFFYGLLCKNDLSTPGSSNYYHKELLVDPNFWLNHCIPPQSYIKILIL